MSSADSPGETYRAAKPFLDSALSQYCARVRTGLELELSDFYVTGRVKAARSLIRKLRKDMGNPRTWDSIQDKVGLRVICSTKSDLKRADSWISKSGFQVLERTVKTGSHDQLYYPGIHYVLVDSAVVDHESTPIPCEVQLRTRAQDAWSAVSHKLLYKGLIEPPNRIKRVISRLTVVVEMFDDEVHRMMKRRKRLAIYRPAMMLEALDERFEALVGEPSGGLPDLDLMLILVRAYKENELRQFENLIDRFLEEHRPVLVPLIEEHQPESSQYVDSRDWLFSQPEVLTVLERLYASPHMLLDVIADTDVEDVVRKVCVSAGKPLPSLR
ncbi:RelA/SpoT domain-containing protein [Rhodoglobus sp. NPDC076762]